MEPSQQPGAPQHPEAAGGGGAASSSHPVPVSGTQPTDVLDVSELRDLAVRPDQADPTRDTSAGTADTAPAATRPLPVPTGRRGPISPATTSSPWEDADAGSGNGEVEDAEPTRDDGAPPRPRRRLRGVTVADDDEATTGGGRARRRGRRVLAVLLVLLVMAGATVLGLNLYVRSTVEHAVLSALPGLSKDATVHTPSWILPQVMGGSIDRVTVDGDRLELASGDGTTTELDDIRIELTDLGTSSPHTTSRLTVAAVVPWSVIEERVAASSVIMTGTSLDARDDGSIEATTAFLDASLVLRPSLDEDGNIVLTITSATLKGHDVEVDWVTGRLGLDEPQYVVTTDFLPTVTRLTSVAAGQNGLHAVIAGTDLDLDSL